MSNRINTSGPAPMNLIPHNVQEYDDDMRAIVNKHMGFGQGNPSAWVVAAVSEAFQRGVGVGLNLPSSHRPAPEQRRREPEFAERVDPERKAIGAAPRLIGADVVDVQAREIPYTPNN